MKKFFFPMLSLLILFSLAFKNWRPMILRLPGTTFPLIVPIGGVFIFFFLLGAAPFFWPVEPLAKVRRVARSRFKKK